MTDYALTGRKGTGKSKHAVILMRDTYLKQGRRVTTNLDLNLELMFGPYSKKTYVRVPDRPRAFDLLAAGSGNPDSYDEDDNGGLFLDEMATWLNTRSFADKERAALLDYFAHARKYGYDTWYIMQSIVQVDKQLRESFVEQLVKHTAFKKVRIPFVGWILSALFGERAGFFPNFHTAVYRMGIGAQDLIVNRASFIGKDVEKFYDTRQVFTESYPHGTHSVLSPWHIKGRFLKPERVPWWEKVFKRAPVVRPARVSPDLVLVRVQRLLDSLPAHERRYWQTRFYQQYGGRERAHLGLR